MPTRRLSRRASPPSGPASARITPRSSADGAQRSAEGAQTTADRGLQRSDVIEKNMVAMNKFDMAKSVTVLFPLNQAKLNDDAKAELDDLAKMTDGKDRFVIEVQGFTDKTGSAAGQ